VLSLHRGLIDDGYDSVLLAPEGSPLLEAAGKADLPHDILRPLRLGLLSRQFDLVHAHDARSHTLAALFSRVAFVVSRRVAFPIRRSAASRWKYRRPALFLAVSRHVGMQLRDAGVEEGSIVVVYDGVAVPSQAANGEAILVPYTLDPQKGMSLAQEAARRASVKIEITNNLGEDLAHARALVYLTRSEGLGSGILLAMAHGVTVIASNTGGIPELIRDGENGILVKNDPADVAKAFSRIDPALGLAGRADVIARFTEKHMIRSTLAAYEKVLS